jgi:hypothetical protein
LTFDQEFGLTGIEVRPGFKVRAGVSAQVIASDAGRFSTPANSRPIECRKPRGSRVMRALTVIALAMLWAGTSLGSVPESAARPGRLPAGIVPVHYSIVLLEHRT